MPFSYGDLLGKITSNTNRRSAQDRALPAEGSLADAEYPAIAAATTAGDSLQDAAARLPDIRELEDDFAQVRTPGAATTRSEALMNSLWKMADDLARVRSEFRAHARPAPLGAPATEVGREDEVEGILAQITAVEASLIAIVAVLTEREAATPAVGDTQDFLARVAQQQATLFRKSGRALCLLRLQAIQLSASVHAFRNSLALAGKAIARAKR